MQTLYELLGALPDDDADKLRAAFRDAAKSSHPDNNANDGDAAQRFRQVVRAYAILRDERQRVTYDSLLIRAGQQRALSSRRKRSSQIGNLVPDAISAAVIAFLSIGAFVLFERVSKTPGVMAKVQASALTAAAPATRPSDTVGRTVERNTLDRTPVSETPEIPGAVEKMTAPDAVAAADNTGSIPAISSVEIKDARYYRHRGHLAYRIGDLALALIDFDMAINLDPDFSDAYIDRAIVFRRIGNLKHAFADIAEAKRIDELKPPQATPLPGQ
ncbi:DnaJ domain-containing protein [Bradyrhizobium lablabi]|uniref:DnaJ domain-containing protein n=1 Tax=Bradyrhizobium lablabi TaxID=722472 RepID=UPI001BAC4B8A|nr:DnaJ domain-containing protein [Bradyrhizobium lablabi]